MAVVVIEERGDVTLRIVFDAEAGPDAAQGIEEGIGRFRFDLGDLAVGIFFIECLALAEEGGGEMAAGVAVFACDCVEGRREAS